MTDQLQLFDVKPTGHICQMCGEIFRAKRYPRRFILCQSCHGLWFYRFSAWMKHGVNLDQCIAWARNPYCHICLEPLDTEKVRTGGKWTHSNLPQGNLRTQVHVDHNHCHCPGVYGCSECVRGLAHGKCNLLVGHIEGYIQKYGLTAFANLIERLQTA